MRAVRVVVVLVAVLGGLARVAGGQGAAATFDGSIAPGATYDKAEFRLWLPQNVEDVLALRSSGTPLSEKTGWLGDLKAKTFDRVPDAGAPNHPTAWLPTERVARAWRSLVTETPLEP